MTLRAGARHFPLAVLPVLALASIADAQTLLSAGAQTSSAAPGHLVYGVDAGLGETDNVTLAPTNKVSQTIATVDADLDYKHQSSRLDVEAKGSFTDFEYLQGAFGNQLLGRFNGLAHFALVPQRLTWVLQDEFGQAALDPFLPTTPGNLEDINYVSTGPDFALRLGGTGFFDASLRAARATFQTSPFNSNRALGSVAAGLQLSPRSTVSLNGAVERVLFDNTVVNGDFDRSSAYLRYDIRGARTTLSVQAGATKITQDASAGTTTIVLNAAGKPVTVPVTIPQAAYSTTGPLARISVSRKLSPTATLSLTGGRELTDGVSSFGSIQGGTIGVVDTVPALLTSSSYTSDFGAVSWRYERNRTTVEIGGNWEKDVYVSQSQFDVTRGGGQIVAERKLSRAFALQVLGRYYKSNYRNAALLVLDGGSPKYDDAIVGAILSWRYGHALEVRLRADHGSRTTPGVDQGYRENRVFLTVGYRPRTPESADSFGPGDLFGPFDAARPLDSPGIGR